MRKLEGICSTVLISYACVSVQAYLTKSSAAEWVEWTTCMAITLVYLAQKRESITMLNALVYFVFLQGIVLGTLDVYLVDPGGDTANMLSIFMYRVLSYDMVVPRVTTVVLLFLFLFFDRMFPDSPTP